MELTNEIFSSSSSDEEILEFINNIAIPRQIKIRRSPMEMYSDEEFRQRYRLNKSTVGYLCDELNPVLSPTSQRKVALSVLEQVCIALRYYATGTFQIVIGDDINVHKSTVSRVIFNVSKEIAKLSGRFICMPKNDTEILETKAGFYNIAGFPNVLGCIDGTHIPIISPGGDNAELFRNRKGYFSLNIQAVCDAKLTIRDIDARWHGSTHDSTIYHGSYLRARLENNEFGNSYLLGDSAYPCGQQLLTPILDPTQSMEERYNKSHIKTRNTIERTFGVWKRKFACLSMQLRVKLDCALAIIVATAILHNIAVQQNDNFEYEEEVPQLQQPDELTVATVEGNAFRRSIAIQYFR